MLLKSVVLVANDRDGKVWTATGHVDGPSVIVQVVPASSGFNEVRRQEMIREFSAFIPTLFKVASETKAPLETVEKPGLVVVGKGS